MTNDMFAKLTARPRTAAAAVATTEGLGPDQHAGLTQVQPNKAASDDSLPDQKSGAREPATAADEEAVPTTAAQNGVQGAEAITLTWKKSNLIAAYIFMFLLYFCNAMSAQYAANLSPYVVSGFELHSLLATIGVITNVMCAGTYFVVAKMLDVWGRPQGFVVMASCATLGLILSASSYNITSYCAAQVFYQVGFVGMIYSIDVITSDTSKISNRGLAFALTASPYIITAFGGPKASESFYEKISWRWAFGSFCIILPFIAGPFFSLLWVNKRRADKRGLVVKQKSGRTFAQNVVFYLIEFDAAGVFLLVSGLALFLLPFSLADSAPNGWKSSYIIGMLIGGFFIIVVFVLYEAYLAKVPFAPYHLITDRGIIGILLLATTWQIAYYCWNSYFTSFLQVVNNVSIAEAGYISSTYDVVGGVWLFIIGYLMKVTGRYKWCLYFAIPLYILAVGLMIYFRQPGQSVGYLIMCQLFIALAGTAITLVEQIGIMAHVDHQHVAAVLALLGMFGYIGGAIGNSISGAIWTNTFPDALRELLPADALENFDAIYGDLATQLSYEPGSETRIAIQLAYGVAQKRMLIAGEAVMALAIVWTFLIKDINLKNIKQTKGMLF